MKKPTAVPGGARTANSSYLDFGRALKKRGVEPLPPHPGETASLQNGVTWNTTIHPYDGNESDVTGTSIFDPVLCEVAYRWFCPPGGAVLDPFAGGSVRGIVASKLGLKYTGIDLSERQVRANRAQAAKICARDKQPRWIVGDSRELARLLKAEEQYDLVFTCPPYGDLEVYSEDPRDISTFEYPEFIRALASILEASARRLRPNRFAVLVVGDFRDPRGMYRSFPADTIRALGEAGLALYNDAVLVTAVGSLPIRIGAQFGEYRKLGKTHQNVLTFYNGEPERLPVEFPEIEEVEAPGGQTETAGSLEPAVGGVPN